MRFFLLAALFFSGYSCLSAEPPPGAQNEFGRWRRAEPGDFVPINRPAFASAEKADLPPDSKVIGVVTDAGPRAYPLRVMTYHHIVNETVGTRRLSVTYCGMANTAVVFERSAAVGNLEAGGLFGGSLAMREQGTGNCWAQIAPVTLPEDKTTTGTLIPVIPSVVTTWERWRRLHPESTILLPVSGNEIEYEAYDRKQPGFVAYTKMNETITSHDPRLGPGAEVFGLSRNADAWACELSELKRAGAMEAMVDGKSVRVVWDVALDAPRVEGDFDGYAMRAYWYAWSQTHPQSRLVTK